MFSPIEGSTPKLIRIEIDGRLVDVPESTTVAAALLHAGVRTFRRTPVGDAPRGPFCMMGVCFDCLVEIDGQPNRQSCMVEVKDGMRVNFMNGARSLQ
ncbi:(2Fe-2S)-binding protein [Burkholderia sp. 22PA0099]|uniref:(2Fe-2S)-binding protein n=1 Tax=Burkholderia sp. 22PA0099 TaxID=3237372 RepID=UPI0039C38E67